MLTAFAVLSGSAAVLAFILIRSSVLDPRTASASDGTSTSAGTDGTTDFRFLPAIARPSPAPTATLARTPTAPPASLSVGLTDQTRASLTGVAVDVAWSAPGGKPIGAGATLQTGVDAANLRTVANSRGTSRVVQTVQTGRDIRYRVDVTPSTRTVSSSAIVAFRLRMVDDRDAAITYSGTWADAGYPGYLRSSAQYSVVGGSSATFSFTGLSVAWIGPVGPGRGRATVSVDGGAASTVSLADRLFQPRRVVFTRSWAESGEHVIRITLASGSRGTVGIDSFAVLGPPQRVPAEPSGTPTPSPTPTPSLPSATLPLRGAFYYGWYPEAWPASAAGESRFHPSAGRYDSSEAAILAAQVAAMRYGRIDVGIASWWGQGTRTDGRMPELLAAAHGTGLAWAVNDEVEEVSDPASATIGATLKYVAEQYSSDPAYLRIDGRFVVFVGAAAGDDCTMVARWVTANTVHAFLVLPAVAGSAGCSSQPDLWYAADPSIADLAIDRSSYAISPGYWRQSESARLERDPARWSQSIRQMVASNASLQLIASFNQWADGSSVENATEWSSASGFGTYLDALHVNGATEDIGSSSPTPGTGPVDPVLVGAGAIASCGNTNDEATAAILASVDGTVFTVGDNAFDSGTIAEYRACYEPSWGAFRDRTRPAAGNRDYLTPGAAGYFAYFGAAAGAPTKGYYAYNLGSWRIYVLNSNCSRIGGCGVDSPQEKWLRSDLKAHPSACIGAYWQAARFSSGRFLDDVRMQPFWKDLYAHGAEFVINGHDHNYQRYAPLTPTGVRDPVHGIREFVVGTGGNGHTALRNAASAANREAGTDKAYGVLRITLHPTGYEWQFLSTAKVQYDDSGAQSCH